MVVSVADHLWMSPLFPTTPVTSGIVNELHPEPALVQQSGRSVQGHLCQGGWLGWAMVLGNFQCRGVLLLWHMKVQGPAVLAASAGRVGCLFIFYFFVSSILSSFSNASSLWGRLDILKYCGLGRYNPMVVFICAYLTVDSIVSCMVNPFSFFEVTCNLRVDAAFC